MDIEIPSWLQWVAPLAGGAWPQGSETGMAQLASFLRAAGRGLVAVIPDLARVRAQTQAVFSGQTARSVDAQFALLFDGPSTVDQLGQAGDALADSVDYMGTEIGFAKMQILTMLALAAVSIRMALANAPWTSGASLSAIPVIEAATEQSIGRVVMLAIQRITAALADKLGSTMVARLLVEGVIAGGIGAGQDAGLEGIQVLEGRRTGIDWGQVWHAATAMAEAGVAGAVTGQVVGGCWVRVSARWSARSRAR